MRRGLVALSPRALALRFLGAAGAGEGVLAGVTLDSGGDEGVAGARLAALTVPRGLVAGALDLPGAFASAVLRVPRPTVLTVGSTVNADCPWSFGFVVMS